MERLKENWPTVLAVTVMIAAMASAQILGTQAGTPIHNVGLLGTQPQELLWKDGQTALFRATDGTEKLVSINTASLEIGATYLVTYSQKLFVRSGFRACYYLRKT